MAAFAAALKRDIEDRLAHRIPAALSPHVQTARRLFPTGKPSLDNLLDGGFSLGTLCEITGPECSGRTAIALALLAAATCEAACAYVDVGDSCSPHSAAAAGVALRNLLWIRIAAAEHDQRAPAPVRAFPSGGITQSQPSRQHDGGRHPRDEARGLSPALEGMLFQKDERLKRKTEGTPGYPNQPLSLLEATADQVAWEQFNSRKVDERDPLRQLDQAAAAAARERATAREQPADRRLGNTSPWQLLDRALRATDQVLQTGGFHTVVLDLASLPPEQTQRIPSNSWWRFQKAATHSDCIVLVLSAKPCTGSSADCTLECAAADQPGSAGIFTSASSTARLTRQRGGLAPQRKAPGRVTSLHSVPAWMRAVGR